MNMVGLDPGDFLSAAFRYIVGGLLLVAGVAKILARESFSKTLRRFPITRLFLSSPRLATRAAVVLSLFEAATGLTFVVGYQVQSVGILVMSLLAAFTVGIFLVLIRGEDVECGCFGNASSESISWGNFVRNLILITLAYLGTLFPRVSLDGVLAGLIREDVWTVSLVVCAQSAVLVALARAFFHLRSLPTFLRRMPAYEGSEVWAGAPELTWRRTHE